MRKYSVSPAEVRFAKWSCYGFPDCIYGVSVQISKAASWVCRGTLNTKASSLPPPGWAHVSDSIPHSKEWKMALALPEAVGISWGNVAFACPAVMLHARYSLWATARAALVAGWVFDMSQPPFTRSEIIRDCFDCNMGSILNPMLSESYMDCVLPLRRPSPGFPLGIQFSVLHCEGFTEPETWPLLPPCGWLFGHRTWGWQGILPAWFLHPASPWQEAETTHPSCDPLPLVHGEVFASPYTAWASKLASRRWVCPAAGQEKAGFGRCLSDRPLGYLRSSYHFMPPRSHHCVACLHVLSLAQDFPRP